MSFSAFQLDTLWSGVDIQMEIKLSEVVSTSDVVIPAFYQGKKLNRGRKK